MSDPEQQHVNPAYRLHILLKAAVSKDPKWTQLRVWSSVFGLDNLSGRPQKQAVIRGFDLIYEQLDQILEYLKSNHCPKDAYQDLQAKIDTNIAPEFLNHQWESFNQALMTQVVPLAIFSAMLPHQENLIDPNELKSIREELEGFEKSLEGKGLSAEVRHYLKRQFGFIHRAMWEYQFRGLHALEDAMLDTLREASVSRETLASHKDDPEVKEISKLWGKLWQTVIKAGQVGAALKASEEFYRLVASTLTGHPH